MSDSSELRCARCGTPIPPGATDQLCPACLMSGALKSPIDETVSMQGDQSPLRREPTHFPCQFGGYRLRGLLGRGGMGTVYDAVQIATGRRVALKTLGRQLDSPEMRQRFLREGRLAARVNHPNSLYVFGSEEIEGLPVITMEVAGAGTLKDQLKNRGPLPVSQAVDAILDVISGLQSAYAGGVLHRDIKPSNCFVCPGGSVKVGDFGLSVSTLARTDSFVTAHGKILGTPTYASPEQLRGDQLDVRADIYSVGATLYTLLTNRPPFEGNNAVQVVANAVNKKPTPLSQLRAEVPPGLERVVARCLAKEPQGRYADYTALREALLPFSSKEPEPASILVRLSAGWIDFLVAFLPPYLALMLWVGADGLLVRPLVERTLDSARYYFMFLGCGLLYFSIVEGMWGAGLGKWLKGLQVVRSSGQQAGDTAAPGFLRALIRILVPVGCCEGVRMPLMLTFISDAQWTGPQTALYVIAAIVCGWIPVLLTLGARRENGFATVWDRVSGTRVVIRPTGSVRPSIERTASHMIPAEATDLSDSMGQLGPYQMTGELITDQWLVAADPVLRRPVWLLRRRSPQLSPARRNVARPGRPRWLQPVESGEATWDAFEATPGAAFASLVEDGERIPWGTLRYWLDDVASELWDATGDETLPAELSLDHVWITTEGRVLLLEQPWPEVKAPAEGVSVGDITGQQRFLADIAACVETTSLPLHARPVLKNLEDGKFEKLSFVAGTLRGLLDKPAEVSRGIRAGSIFMLPAYVWIAVLVGRYHDKPWNDPLGILTVSALVVLLVMALVELVAVPFRSTASHAIFRLAVVDDQGEPASASRLVVRWAIIWLPLCLPALLLALLSDRTAGAVGILSTVLLLLWICAAIYAVIHPNRGLQDALARTWVVRR